MYLADTLSRAPLLDPVRANGTVLEVKLNFRSKPCRERNKFFY